jgi:phage shock protein C
VENRLQRSRDHKMIGGVCGGLAEYFRVDPTLVRVLLVIVTLFGGAGVILYAVLWVLMPLAPPPPPAPV